MKAKIPILFLLFINLSFAQLSVSNNAYVFVNDEVVFVEDDVNLINASSTIYLRNEGQLIQGTGTETAGVKNSGIGNLSVYQNGNVGAYEYNYWCSPTGSITSTTTNNPFGISLLNDITGLTTSTPATFTTSSNFNGTANPLNIEPYWIWKYIASGNYSDWIHVEGATTINPGEGFSMKGTNGTSANNSGDNQNYEFRGKPNTGTLSVSVLDDNYTLVGNPYPSAIDALAYIHDVENAAVITGTLFYWEQDPSVNSHFLRDYDGGYATYTITSGGVPTYVPATFSTYNGDGTINGAGSGSPSGKEPRRYIPIGQGFMVEGTATGTVKAKNAHRVYIKETNTNSEFFKMSNTKNKIVQTKQSFSSVPDDFKRFRLNIDFNDTYTRQLLENFHASATFGFDYGMESQINPADVLANDAYFYNDNSAYVAEALPFTESLKIPLTIKLNQNMPVRIRIADIQNFDTNLPIYIHDIENNQYVNLKVQNFDINLEAGNHTNRFEITFQNDNTLNANSETFNSSEVFHNNITSELKIINTNLLDVKSFYVYDVSGKQILNNTISEIKNQYTYSTKRISDGIYIVKINLANNQVYTKRIIVNKHL